MANSEQLLIALLRSDHIKENLLPHLSTSDICALRQTSSACCNILTKGLFTRIHISFNASTFTKPHRVNALARIGHHIEHVTFYLPHSKATFLPPLIHPLTGQEISFLYTPHTSMGSVLTRPKYANTELGEILTQQYPPLFHAATNVPSFINAMKFIPNMRHLTIRCPGQDPQERYRRDIVDYALISLRISIERAPLEKLSKLSLSSMHPSAFNYLRHLGGIGCVPSAEKRWRQIKKLYISVESWDFYGPSPGLDHLKIMDDYIRGFASRLDKFSFTWIGRKGPCPVSLSGDPLFAPPRTSKKLFHEVTSPMSPLPTRPSRTPIHFPRLRFLQIRNATMNAPQLSTLINSHRPTVKEFDFDNVALLNNGNWDEALASVENDKEWSKSGLTTASECSLVTSSSFEDLPSPSAAVEAASRELLDVDLGGFGFNDEEREVIESLSDDIPAAAPSELSMTSYSTKLKKRTRRRRRKHRSDDEDTRDAPSPSSQRSQSSQHSSPRRRHRDKPSRPRLQPSLESEILRPSTPVPNPIITAPILNADPQPVLLQPTIYDPSTKQSSPARPDDGISSVQRNIEQEEAHRLLAEDAAARVSALQKAKEAVLMKLSREFCNKKSRLVEAGACRLLAGRDLSTAFGPGMVMEDRRGTESHSALVPLMFSRS